MRFLCCEFCSFTNRWILPKQYRIPRIQSTGVKKVNKLKSPSNGASILLRSKKKTICWGVEWEGGRDQGGRGYMEAKRGTRSGTEGWKFFKKHLASKDNVNKSYRKITAERR
jgi:hypothetical protein